jgi:peptide methionine sulfoxide reductase MsrB
LMHYKDPAVEKQLNSLRISVWKEQQEHSLKSCLGKYLQQPEHGVYEDLFFDEEYHFYQVYIK